MGVMSSLAHLLLKSIITSIVLMVMMVAVLQIEYTKVGPLMILVFLATTVGNIAASVILMKHWGVS